MEPLTKIHVDTFEEARLVQEFYLNIKLAPTELSEEWEETIEGKIGELIQKGISKSVRNIDGSTALHCCIRHGKLKALQYLVDEQNFDINTRDFLNETPLHFAIKNGAGVDFFDYLMERGADVNSRGECGLTPLHYACMTGERVWVNALLWRNVEVNAQSISYGYPLHVALSTDRDMFTVEIVRELIQNGARVNDLHSGMSPLAVVISKGPSPILVVLLEILLANGANPNLMSTVEGDVVFQPLDLACDQPEFPADAVRVLLDGGANPNFINDMIYKPIKVAAMRGNREVVEVLFPVTAHSFLTVDDLMDLASESFVPQFEESRLFLMVHFLQSGDAEDAIENLPRAFHFYLCAYVLYAGYEVSRDNMTICLKLSKCLIRLRDAQGALRHVAKCLRNALNRLDLDDDAGCARLFFCMAEAWKDLKFLPQAEECYFRAMSLISGGQLQEYITGLKALEGDKRSNNLYWYTKGDYATEAFKASDTIGLVNPDPLDIEL